MKLPRHQSPKKLLRAFLVILLPLVAVLALSDYGRIEKTAVAKTTQSSSGNNPWQTVDEKSVATRSRQTFRPRAYRALQLDLVQLQKILSTAPKEFSAAARKSSTLLSLPLPDGIDAEFRVVDSPIMEPALAARFPEIKTYTAQSAADPTVTGRFGWTEHGFHAIIFSHDGTVLIEPFEQGNKENYISYFQKDMPAGAFECDVPEAEQETAALLDKKSRSFAPAVTSGGTLRTYRLAVGVTAEFTSFYGGGTVSGALSAVTTTVNLVDAIYERDIAVRFVLIANETDIIYTDTLTDGYTSNDVNSLISQNQTKLDSVIGNANYDIGHVYDGRSNGGGFSFQGLGSFGVVCRSGFKARGVSITRSVSPSSVIAYYSNAHEIGHQFNATHTFNAGNGNCASQRSPSTAYEPGTGTTIMGYRFNCAPEDFMSSDTYFHVASLEQMVTFSTLGPGGSC